MFVLNFLLSQLVCTVKQNQDCFHITHFCDLCMHLPAATVMFVFIHAKTK